MAFRPERFVENLRAHVDEAASEQVTANLPPYEECKSPAREAAWIGELMVRLEVAVGPEVAGAVMEACGRQCIGASTLERGASWSSCPPRPKRSIRFGPGGRSRTIRRGRGCASTARFLRVEAPCWSW